MLKTLCLAAFVCAATAIPALADDSIEYPVDNPYYPFQRSCLNGRAVFIPPYGRAFPIRVYTTPQRSPYYNVPPYQVIAPY